MLPLNDRKSSRLGRDKGMKEFDMKDCDFTFFHKIRFSATLKYQLYF